MSFQDLLKASLESDMNEETHDIVEEGFDAEGALMMEHPSDGDIDVIDEEMEALTLAESMEMVADTIGYILAKGEQNGSTAAMVQMSIDRLYAHQGISSPMASMEAYLDIKQYHVDSMEGLRETAAAIRKRVAESVKSRTDDLLYKFKSEENKIVQAQGRLEKALASYNAKKGSLKEDMVVKFDALGKFMTNDKGVVKDLYAALVQDFSITEYLIHTYSKAHASALTKMAGAVKNASLTDDKAIDAVIGKIRAIKHPAKQIPTKYTSGYPLLGTAGVSVSKTKGSQENHELGEVAEFYTTEIKKDSNKSKQDFKEGAKDFALIVFFGATASYHVQKNYDDKYSTTMKGNDLDRLVGSMKKYLSNLKDARKSITDLLDAHKSLGESLTTMKPSEHISKEKAVKLAHVGRCGEMLLRNGHKAAEAGLDHALYVVGAITYILETMVRRAK